MDISLKALDTLFFRDGKPFTMGEDTAAQSVFPPYPSVLYGALRTWYMSQQNDPLANIKKSGEIKILEYYFELDGKHATFPLPLDLVVEKGLAPDEDGLFDAHKLSLESFDQNLHSGPDVLENSNRLLIAPSRDGKRMEVENMAGFISPNELNKYLRGGDKTKIFSQAKYVEKETKIGIAQNKDTNTVRESALYSLSMVRPKNFSLCIKAKFPENYQLPTDQNWGFIRLGGENKITSVYSSLTASRIENLKKVNIINKIDDKVGIKLLLLSPAIFKNGFDPELEKDFPELKLIAACTGKPLAIGGFDVENQKPKKMFKVVPAGSVYYYQTQQTEHANELRDQIYAHFAAKNSVSSTLSDQGFGLFLLGNI